MKMSMGMSKSALKEAYLRRLDEYCDKEKVKESSLHPEKYDIHTQTCWLCWIRLTGNLALEEWRRFPFYARGISHEKTCPVCGYSRWSGAVWYPFRYLALRRIGIIGNPSLNYSKKKKA